MILILRTCQVLPSGSVVALFFCSLAYGMGLATLAATTFLEQSATILTLIRFFPIFNLFSVASLTWHLALFIFS